MLLFWDLQLSSGLHFQSYNTDKYRNYPRDTDVN